MSRLRIDEYSSLESVLHRRDPRVKIMAFVAFILLIVITNPSSFMTFALYGIFILILAALNIIPVALAALIGMLIIFLSGCITPEEAYRAVNWKVLFLIGGMLALGLAVQDSGTAEFLANSIVRLMKDMHVNWLLGGFFLLTMILSQPMSNQAAAAVVVPVAIQTAAQLGYDPRSFAIMIALGASCSFITSYALSSSPIRRKSSCSFTIFPESSFAANLSSCSCLVTASLSLTTSASRSLETLYASSSSPMCSISFWSSSSFAESSSTVAFRNTPLLAPLTGI